MSEVHLEETRRGQDSVLGTIPSALLRCSLVLGRGVVNLHLSVDVREAEKMNMLYKVAAGVVQEEHYGLALAKVVDLLITCRYPIDSRNSRS